ncbi:MAG TPA: 2Fe-2S iron-sulfur cluster binding domain-containing protein [Rhodospirillaceae bacterium]|nr:2Fe-2S iron-sulfur cluster binding domain-containing protein [Rhodospirillaceae bacterium]
MSDTQETNCFFLDDEAIPFTPGQTIIQAALTAGKYIPHLCYHPEFKPHGSCKLCTVRIDSRTIATEDGQTIKIPGRAAASCTTPAQAGQHVESNIPELLDLRRTLIQMLLVEGNHFCPSCEKSGSCLLQGLAYALGVMNPHFPQYFSKREVDASHPDILLDLNRCILCELCIRASAEVDKKHVFSLSGRGHSKHLICNAESGKLGDTNFSATDKAANVCPVGVILHKRHGFETPYGQRRFDQNPINAHAEQYAPVKEQV